MSACEVTAPPEAPSGPPSVQFEPCSGHASPGSTVDPVTGEQRAPLSPSQAAEPAERRSQSQASNAGQDASASVPGRDARRQSDGSIAFVPEGDLPSPAPAAPGDSVVEAPVCMEKLPSQVSSSSSSSSDAGAAGEFVEQTAAAVKELISPCRDECEAPCDSPAKEEPETPACDGKQVEAEAPTAEAPTAEAPAEAAGVPNVEATVQGDEANENAEAATADADGKSQDEEPRPSEEEEKACNESNDTVPHDEEGQLDEYYGDYAVAHYDPCAASDRLYREGVAARRQRDALMEQRRRALEERFVAEQAEECTFKPRINSYHGGGDRSFMQATKAQVGQWSDKKRAQAGLPPREKPKPAWISPCSKSGKVKPPPRVATLKPKPREPEPEAATPRIAASPASSPLSKSAVRSVVERLASSTGSGRHIVEPLACDESSFTPAITQKGHAARHARNVFDRLHKPSPIGLGRPKYAPVEPSFQPDLSASQRRRRGGGSEPSSPSGRLAGVQL